MMNPEIKERWIDALLSGEYQQGFGFLHLICDSIHKFCCLGVLTDLYLKEHNIEWEMAGPSPDYSLGEGECMMNLYQNNYDTLSEDVMKWAGISSEMGDYGQDQSLTIDNDSGKSFSEIAKIIQEKF